MARPPPFRRFTHPDGREWEARQVGAAVELCITTTDGEAVERRRPFDAPSLAARDLEALVAEQLTEGFTEQTPPEWRRRLDELVTFWDQDDPGFDAEVLRSQFLEAGEPLTRRTLELLTTWEAGQPHDPQAARLWFREHLDAVLPGLLLALRYPEAQVLARLDAFLAELKLPGVLEALLSVVEHPTALHPEGEDEEPRPAHMPLAALLSLGKPDSDTALRLFHALEHADPRARDVAAAVLAEFSHDDGFFAALWDRRTVARESDGMCWAMLRAAEVRKAPELRPFLLWMQKSARFKGPAWGTRVGDALAHLRNR